MNPFSTRQCLGRKTFWLFMLKNSVGALIFFGLLIVFFILASIGSATAPIEAFFILGLLISGFLFILLALIAFGWTWYEYKNYTFILDDHALEVSRGIITKENISIPYHHIEDVDIDQSLFYQMLGVCRLVIMTAAHPGGADNSNDPYEGILPIVDLNMGRQIQKIIMERSNVQEVINVDRPATANSNEKSG